MTTKPQHTPFALPVVASDMLDEGVFGVIDRNNKILAGARLTKEEADYVVEAVNGFSAAPETAAERDRLKEELSAHRFITTKNAQDCDKLFHENAQLRAVNTQLLEALEKIWGKETPIHQQDANQIMGEIRQICQIAIKAAKGEV